MDEKGPSFLKFPRTPHLFPAPGSGGDRVVTPEQQSLMLRQGKGLIVEEKIDGSNLGIRFDADGFQYFQTRTHYIGGERGTHPQHHRIFNWFWERRDDLWKLLEDKRIMYGEWLYARHTIKYESLPDYYMVFDILDVEENKFWGADYRNERLHALGIATPPRITVGIFKKEADFDKILAEKSALGCPVIEGVYLRLDEGDRLVQRAKIVRPEFRRQHLENDDWSHTHVREQNEVKAENN